MKNLRSLVIQEKVKKVSYQIEALRNFNYPTEALEEAVVNSLYHRSWQEREPVEITIEKEKITILNFPGPDRTIPDSAVREGMLLKSRRYRNKRLGEFLKELDLTEGRSTGIPTIQRELAANGSPKAWIETDPDRLSCLMYIPVHPAFLEGVADDEHKNVTGNVTGNVGKNEHKNEHKNGGKKQSERQKKILAVIKDNPTVSISVMADEVGVAFITLRRELARMSDIIRHVGPKNGGYWEIIE